MYVLTVTNDKLDVRTSDSPHSEMKGMAHFLCVPRYALWSYTCIAEVVDLAVLWLCESQELAMVSSAAFIGYDALR